MKKEKRRRRCPADAFLRCRLIPSCIRYSKRTGIENALALQCWFILRKEVIQPQVPLRLPCYDFTPVMNHKVVSALPKVKLPTSFATHSHGVTGGVYKARERIHRGMLIHDY